MTEASEFSRPIELSRLPPGGRTTMAICASTTERAALGHRFGLLALDRLEARATLEWIAGKLVRLDAELSADVVQACVVTLEPVANRVEDHFTLLYRGVGEVSDILVDGEAELVEPIVAGSIDIGEAVAQQLSLALDPYPRRPAAAAPATDARRPEDSPFAVLARRGKG
jgi:uncharacterized metal-binding protein YceD (DUF177 family)